MASDVGTEIAFSIERPGRVSLAVYSPDGAVQHRSLLVGEPLEPGRHAVRWDGLDCDGRPLEAGSYQWKLIFSPGLRAEFLDALGANPPGGPWARWIGNHHGPSTIAVSGKGVCVGTPIAEGPPNIHMFEPDFATTRWFSPQAGWSSIGHRALAMTETAVVSLSQDARVAVLDLDTGAGRQSFDVLWEGDLRPDHDGGRELHLDAHGDRFVVSYLHHDAVRWFDLESGATTREVKIAGPRRVALREDGAAYVLGRPGVVRVDADDRQTVVVDAAQLVNPSALAWDASNRTLLVAHGAPDHRILRFAEDGRLLDRYGVEGGRRPGPYHPDRFAEVADIAAHDGRCYVVEGGEAGGGLRRIAVVGADGTILDERFGGAEFFSAAAATPGNPREVYYSSCPNLIGRYELDPRTGNSRLTHLLRNRHQGFPGFGFPHYRPVVRGGRVYLVHQGRFILRPDLENGELVPVALADHRPWHGWRTVPEMIARAAAHHGIDAQSNEANAYTWSDTNDNGRMDPEEFRFYHTAPRPDRAFLDDEFNILFGYYSAWNHTYDTVNSRWLGFDYDSSLYATLPNDAPDSDVPVWNWSRIVLSEAKVPKDPLGLWQRISGTPFTHSDGRVDVLMRAGGGSHADLHPHPWPTAQTTGTRIMSAVGDRVVHVVGKHASEGPPRDTQFGEPVVILGVVNDIRIVCDRAYYTSAWTADGLFVGMLLERPDYGPQPENPVGLAGDDWLAAGSIADLGNGEALWFAPSMDRAMMFRVRGFGELQRQSGTVDLRAEPPAAPLDGVGLHAEYFTSTDLSGEPVVARIDPRLWFYDRSKADRIVAAWAADGPCEGIAAGEPFSARWTGSLTAACSEPFWLRVYNTRHGHGHTPDQQTWADGQGFVRVWLNDQLMLDKWWDSPGTNPWQTPPLRLEAGTRYDLKVEYAYPGGKAAQFSLVWCSYTLEWMRVPTPYLHPKAGPTRPCVSVEAFEPLAYEECERPGVVRFSLDAPQEQDLVIGYHLGGTAAADTWALAGDAGQADVVIIPAGETGADLIVRPADDDRIEANQTVILTLAPNSLYAGDGSAGAAVVTIIDNDNILIDDDLIVYYTFDDASLRVQDNFAHVRNEAGVDHALRIQSYLHTMPRLVPGLPRHGDALDFPDGGTSVRSMGQLALGDFSVAFWFKASRPTSGICEAGPVNFSLTEGRLHANFGGWDTERAGTDLHDGQWHHAALVWNRDEQQIRLYLDGVRVADNTGPANAGLGGDLRLGHAPGGAFLGGSLDEVRVYARRLTAGEVQSLFSASVEVE